MPNDIVTNTGGGSGGASPTTSSPSTPSAAPATPPSTSTISTNNLSPTPGANSLSQPGNSLAQGQGLTPGVDPTLAQSPTPTEKPFDISQYGGQERLDAAMGFYEKLAANDFNSVDFLNSIAETSPERFNQINRTVLEHYLPDIQQSLIQNLGQDPETKAAALQALGWNPQAYQEYMNYKNSGQNERLQPPDPRVQALENQVKSFEEKQQQALYEQTMQQRQSDYNSFRSEFTQPVNDFIQKMNLPDTKEGNLAKAIIKGATDFLFEQNQTAFKTADDSFKAFMNGNGQLARTNSSYGLRAAVHQHAEEVSKFLGDLIYKASLYDQQQSQPGVRRDPLTAAQAAPTGQRQPSPQASNGQPPTGSPFDPDYVMQRVNAKLGIS